MKQKIHSIFKLLRVNQWTKNLFCLAGSLFGVNRFLEVQGWGKSILVFFIFCFASSIVYVANDIIDRERDRHHPRKKTRPIASGQISIFEALQIAVVLMVLVIGLSFFTLQAVWICVGLYLINNVVYSLWVKNMVVLDVFSIALGFMLRLLAGIYALHDMPTIWIVLCTLFLALFLGFCKRYAEVHNASLTSDKAEQRPVLTKYHHDFINSLIDHSATMTIMCYALFITTSGKNTTLILTLPPVFYAIMHYKLMLRTTHAGEEPEMILLHDREIKISILVWLILYILITHMGWKLFI